MKKLLILVLLIAFAGEAFAQRQTFDLVTFTAPKGWAKKVEATFVSFIKIDNKTQSWCRINVSQSTVSNGSIAADFESEWQELIERNYSPTRDRKEHGVQETDGWKIKAGSGSFTFDGKNATVILATASGYDRRVSIVATTNNPAYLKDVDGLISSVVLVKPEASSKPATSVDEQSISGIWMISASNQSHYAVNHGVSGNTRRQYTFNSDGTYTFFVKSFQPTFDKLLLTRESGAYKVSGNTITVSPRKSVIEAWSKKDNSDRWGTLLSTQKRKLEKVTYTFAKHYFSGIQEWNLVLQAAKQTERDGPYNGGSAFNDAWLYGVGKYPIELPN